LVPVKDFSVAKLRLAPAVPPAERALLARAMAEKVIRVWAPERGLNHAVQDGVRQLARLGVAHVTVAHSDLPLAEDLTWVGDWPAVTLVPDRREDGTTVIGLRSDSGFVFSYGPGSFRRHLAEAERLGLAVRVVHSPALSWDVDLPADLTALAR
jgi:2-phospho-L-lactate guanylyltransferase